MRINCLNRPDLMNTSLSGLFALVLIASSVGPARSEFDDYASFASDATQQDDGWQGSCDQTRGCVPTAPNMIGDSIGAPFVARNGVSNIGVAPHYLKVAENNNVLPQTRVAFDYSLYCNVAATWDVAGDVTGTADVTEFKVRIEKAFAAGNWSANLILPFYHTISFQQSSFPSAALGGEFGNLGFGFKRLLRRSSNYALSGGLMIEAPTSRDCGGAGGAGRTVLNDQWFLTPYIAMQYTPHDRLFAHSFVSYRFRTGVNDQVGDPTDPIQSERLMLDAGVGYWLLRNHGRHAFVTGLAPTVELHYTTSAEDQAPALHSHTYFNRVDMLNLTAGATVEFVHRSTLAVAVALPLRENTYPGGTLPTDRSMDWEFIAQFNHRY